MLDFSNDMCLSVFGNIGLILIKKSVPSSYIFVPVMDAPAIRHPACHASMKFMNCLIVFNLGYARIFGFDVIYNFKYKYSFKKQNDGKWFSFWSRQC